MEYWRSHIYAAAIAANKQILFNAQHSKTEWLKQACQRQPPVTFISLFKIAPVRMGATE